MYFLQALKYTHAYNLLAVNRESVVDLTVPEQITNNIISFVLWSMICRFSGCLGCLHLINVLTFLLIYLHLFYFVNSGAV